jgi:amino-acid N-acetyltransferase
LYDSREPSESQSRDARTQTRFFTVLILKPPLMTVDSAPPFSIRRAAPADVDSLHRFIAPFVEQGRLLPRTQDELEELTETGFLAETDGHIVGFAALEIYSPKLAELRSLAVAAEYQGRGIGKALVRACAELAREQRIFEVMAITSSDEFFKHCGFDFTLPGEKKAVFLQTRESY